MAIAEFQAHFSGRNRPFRYRAGSVGDEGVIRQIFVDRDYDYLHWDQGKALRAHAARLASDKPLLIVDVGANIGAAAVFFSMTVENAIVYAIEPDVGNFELLRSNTQDLDTVIPFHGAAAAHDGHVFLEDPGQSDWGFRTNKNANGPNAPRVESVSPTKILKDPRVEKCAPLIFKVDIEGGERDLFEGNVEWMDRFPLVIVELHDWLMPFAGTSRNFLKAAARYDFDFVHRGENIFLFNRRILAP